MDKRYLVLAAMMLLLYTGCKTAQDKGEMDVPTYAAVFSAPEYMKVLNGRQSTEQNLTAKVKATIHMDGKSISTNGTLKMRKGDVVQISLVDPLVGIAEVGRMEFAPHKVMIIDRFNKQYVDVPYNEISFLQRADIDFNALQALFWNEVFVPGKTLPTVHDFTFAGEGGQAAMPTGVVNIGYKDRVLHYQFRTIQPKAELQRTAITSSKDPSAVFAFDYGDFGTFEGKPFPRLMTMSFVLGQKKASLTFELSSLRNSSDWEAHTPAPKKYKKADVEKIFRALVN